ncbi:41859_t:CDS:2, partial [Gigaspora margarita]
NPFISKEIEEDLKDEENYRTEQQNGQEPITNRSEHCNSIVELRAAK